MAEKRRFLTSPFSVARGALVAAAQALWILGDDEPTTRQQRALSIGTEWLVQRIGYQTEQLKICSPEQAKLSKDQIDQLLMPMLDEARSKRRRGTGTPTRG